MIAAARTAGAGHGPGLPALLATLLLLGPAGSVASTSSYQVDLVSYPGATTTAIRGVDASGRALAYWARYDSPLPPVFQPPDASGYFFYEGGVIQDLAVPGLTASAFWGMNDAGVIWGRAEEGAFVWDGASSTLVAHPGFDSTGVRGVDAAGSIYGFRGNFPDDLDPDAIVIPLLDAGSFVFDGSSYSEPDLGLTEAFIDGVRLDGLLWGSTADSAAFIHDGTSVNTISHPDATAYTLIQGIRDDGLVFGVAGGDSSANFFWSEQDGFTPFELPGTTLESAQGMNGAGYFWGWASPHAFLATPIPEPGSAVLVALGLGWLARGRW